MAFLEKQRSRSHVRPDFLRGHGHQRVQVAIAILGQAHHFPIDGLLARQLNAAQRKPNRRMKPERAANQLFGDHEQPIAAIDMHQLVTQYPNP